MMFDFCASHSFCTQKFALDSGRKPIPLGSQMMVQTPGRVLRTKTGCKGVGNSINGVDFLENLIILKSQGMDVILGMDWLTKHRGLLACAKRTVPMTNTQGVKDKYVPNPTSAQAPHINSLSGIELDQVLVVFEYPDVFRDELPEMPPHRDIEFLIEMMPGAGPIYKNPYRMGSKS